MQQPIGADNVDCEGRRWPRALVLMFLVLLFGFVGRASALAQTGGAARTCGASSTDLPRLSVLAIQTGRLTPGESTCFALNLQKGELIRVAVGAEIGYLRARLLGPRLDQLQVTWISSFSAAAPSLPLVMEAAETGLYRIELSVPPWVPFKDAQSFRIQLQERQSAAVRASQRRMLLEDLRVGWLRDRARRLRTIDPDDEDFSDLEFLREVLGGTRVVLLGEGDGGGGSDVLAKTRLLKFLHERMGFDLVIFQAGIHSSTVAWRALQVGSDPRDALLKSVFGLLGRSTEAGSLINYLVAQARTARPLELAGFDSQFTGTAARTLVPELQTFLGERNISSPFSDRDAVPTRVLAGTIAGQFGGGTTLPSPSEQAQTVDLLQATARELERRAQDADGARWAQVLRSTSVQIDLALNNARGGSDSAYMSGWVRQMADNLKWLVSHGDRDRKVVVWSHTLHVMRSPDATSHGRALGGTVGQGIWETLGPESFAIGLTSYNGRSHWVTGEDDYYQDLIPGQHPSVDFETLMNAAGHTLAFVDLRAARSRGDWLGGRFVASPLYLVPEEAEWSSALDALLFIRTQQPRTRAQ